MKVAVTGGSGQLGALVLQRCVQQRAIREVVCLDLVPPRVASPKVRFERADVRDADVGRHFEGCDAVVHLAFLIWQPVEPGRFRAVNVEGSRNVFEAVARAGVRRLVYTSSVAAYGVVPGHPSPLTEDTPRRYQPGFPYAANKYEVEAILDGFETAHPEVAVVRLRPGVLFGRRMADPLARLLAHRVALDLGDTQLPICWDEDVADAVMLALTGEGRGAFNLVSDEALTSGELAEIGGLRRLRVPRPLRPAAVHAMRQLNRLIDTGLDASWLGLGDVQLVFSSRRAREELGWRPRCATARQVFERYLKEAPGRRDPRIATFVRLVRVASRFAPVPPEARRIRLAIHLDLTGPGGGDLTLRVLDGRVLLSWGIPRPPDAVLTLSARTFLSMLSGKLDAATADLTGKIRLQGEPVAKMALAALVTLFRAQAAQQGARGWAARRLSGWLGEGAAA